MTSAKTKILVAIGSVVTLAVTGIVATAFRNRKIAKQVAELLSGERNCDDETTMEEAKFHTQEARRLMEEFESQVASIIKESHSVSDVTFTENLNPA
jgi:hypothetical protein